MIVKETTRCPYCNGRLRYYDRVSRILREKNGKKKYLKLRRKQCVECRRVHRELPNFIVPFKHYTSDIITGVVEGLITSDTLGFEDYPSENTMLRWMKNAKKYLFPLCLF